MDKLHYALIPSCISFGPLLIAMGMNSSSILDLAIRYGGALVLVAGLGMMFRLISNQQTSLERLLAERNNNQPTN